MRHQPPNKIGRANRRPASPLNAGRQIVSSTVPVGGGRSPRSILPSPVMSTFRNLVFPIAALFMFGAVALLAPVGSFVCMLAVAALMVPGLAFGQRLQMPLRVFITGLVFVFAFALCLSGRVMGAGLTHHTLTMAISAFGIFAALPLLSFLRMWPLRLALLLITAALPICLGLALLAAEVEERSFISRYRESGVGPTPRWTDPNSWLSYDAQTRQLTGTD